MNMNNEPIRLPALVALVVILASAVAIALLLGLDIEQAVALVLSVLAVVAPAVAVTESKRARTDSPATIQAKWDAHAQAVTSDLADRTEPAPAPAIDLSTPAALDDLGAVEIDPADVARRIQYLEDAVNVLSRTPGS